MKKIVVTLKLTPRTKEKLKVIKEVTGLSYGHVIDELLTSFSLNSGNIFDINVSNNILTDLNKKLTDDRYFIIAASEIENNLNLIHEHENNFK